MKKHDYSYSWLDVTITFTVIGIGFGILESIVYAFGASIPVLLALSDIVLAVVLIVHTRKASKQARLS